MNEIKQPAQNNEEGGTRTVFWGTISLAAVTLLISAYFFKVLLAETRTPVIYFGMALFLSGVAAMIVSIGLTVRGRQEQAVKLTLTMLLILGLTAIGLFKGRAATASLTIFVISVIALRALFPSHSRRNYAILVAISLIGMWTIEWLSPPWRIQVQAASAGPIGAIIFAFLLAAIAARRAWGGSLRNKLLTSVIGLTVISTGVLALVSYYNTQSNLTKSSGAALKSVAESQASAIGNLLNQEVHVLQSVALNKLIQDRVQRGNSSYVGDAAKIQAQIDILDKQWRAADAANNNDDPMVYRVLNEVISSQLREFKDAFPENPEVFVTDKYGANIAATNRTSDYYQADEGWWQAAYNDGKGAVYFGEPEFDQSSKTFGLVLAVPIYSHGTQEVSGVMRTTINIDAIATILSAKTLDGTAHTSLYLPGGQVLDPQNPDSLRPADSNATVRLPELITTKPFDTFTLDGVPSVVSAAQITSADAVMQAAITNLGWQIVVNQSQKDNLAPVRQQTRSSTVVALVILAFGVMFALFLAQLLSSPIVRLTSVAEQIAAGNNEVQAIVETTDEIGKLAGTFNGMTAQLRELITSLEQRVADRTRNLELAAEVGRSVSQVRDLDVMLKDACELILKEFNLYYVQVYLTDAAQTTLRLEAGTGNVGAQLLGRGHSLPLNIGSINGRAAMEKRSVVISDTAQSATFRQNPLLPETRGEMAVPLIVAAKVVGVLDMQSSEPGVLNPEVLPAFEALAGQLAVAIQNAKLLAETEQARAEVETQARRLVRKNWEDYLDAINVPEQTGFVFEGSKVIPLSDVTDVHPAAEGNSIQTSISITGESLGSLIVEMDAQELTPQTTELVNIIARQVAQQIENLRLLESAERYRAEAEQAARRITLEGWQAYIKSRTTSNLGYLYDLNEVRPSRNGDEANDSAFTLPLKARDETIGKLSVNGLSPDDKDSFELVNAVAERLGAHIDSLRQYEQTQSALVQTERLFDSSRRLTQATDLQELVASFVAALGISEVNRALLTSFDYDAAGEVKQLTVTANWWNGEGTEVTRIGTKYPLEVIQVMPMFVSPIPVFFDDTFSDERVDTTTMEVVKKLNLRAVAVLPLQLGPQQIGALVLEAEEPHNFTTDETRLFASLAPQIATILENRQQYEKAQYQAKREAMLNIINQKIQSATTVDAVLQIAARELGSALGAPLTIAQLGLKNRSNGNSQ